MLSLLGGTKIGIKVTRGPAASPWSFSMERIRSRPARRSLHMKQLLCMEARWYVLGWLNLCRIPSETIV